MKLDMFPPTKLHELIAEKLWIQALQRAKEYKGEVSCRRKYGIDGKMYKFYPLHLACINKAPLELIETLYEAFPNAIRRPGLNGESYAVHHAIIGSADVDVVHFLLEKWPQVLLIRDTNKLLPLHHALAVSSPAPILHALIVGPTLKERDYLGQTPLHLVAAAGAPLSVVKRMVALCPEALSMNNSGQLKPAELAVIKGRASIEVVEFLVRKTPHDSSSKNNKRRPPPVQEIKFSSSGAGEQVEELSVGIL